MMDDISKLVDQTFLDSEQFGHRNPFQEPERKDKLFSGPHEMPDEVPGILYHVQKNPSTFVIRILESGNLAQDFVNVMKTPEDYPSLRLLEDDGKRVVEKLKFFECDTLNIAKSVRSYLCNKRFPIFEEQVFNVSDPADSWWVKASDDCISIFFKLSYSHDTDGLIKLGPLGDKERAMEKLNKYYAHFSLIFPVEDFSSAHGQFSVSTKDKENINFKNFINLFTTGDVGHDFWMYLVRLELEAHNHQMKKFIQEANYFLMELSVMRRFWLTVEKDLNS